jgi:hypothetical protein
MIDPYLTFFKISGNDRFQGLEEIPFGRGSSIPADPYFLDCLPPHLLSGISPPVDPEDLSINPDPQRFSNYEIVTMSDDDCDITIVTSKDSTRLVFPPPNQPCLQLDLGRAFAKLDHTEVSKDFREHFMKFHAEIDLSFLRGAIIRSLFNTYCPV